MNPTSLQTCPCCGGDLEGFTQEFPRLNRQLELVTCWNAVCAIYGMTHTPAELIELAKGLQLQDE